MYNFPFLWSSYPTWRACSSSGGRKEIKILPQSAEHNSSEKCKKIVLNNCKYISNTWVNYCICRLFPKY